MTFLDRRDAGRQLAARLGAYANRDDVVVLALPRGGVPVGFEVARALGAPLDVFLVRKLGVPGHPELAMGAIASGGTRVLNQSLIDELDIPAAAVEEASDRERGELDRRDRAYREGRPLPQLRNHVVLLVDDGLATGATMEAAVQAARAHEPARIVVAAPVGAEESCARLGAIADEVVCAQMPPYFQAVGMWYVRFDQTSDEEVLDLLHKAAAERTAPRAVRIPLESRITLSGDLTVPAGATGLVVFAHGSGSSRFSPRNVFVAGALNQRKLATLLVDLLTEDEERQDEGTGQLRFDVMLLAERLVGIAAWAAGDAAVGSLPLGLFGASTGAGAALVAAARLGQRVRAVVSRGGRPDLAGPALSQVAAPTLLIVGSNDDVVVHLNQRAMAEMAAAATRLELVHGATHLFEEPGALDRVAELAGDWFTKYLSPL